MSIFQSGCKYRKDWKQGDTQVHNCGYFSRQCNNSNDNSHCRSTNDIYSSNII